MADCSKELSKTVAGFDGINICDNNINNDHKTEEYWRSCAMQLATSSVLPMVMQAVVELGVLEIISKAGVEGASAEEIASQLELSHDATPKTASSMLDRMLYLLASHSILTCSTTTSNDNHYGLGPLGIYFVPNSDGVSFGPLMSWIQDKIHIASWAELKPAVLGGGIPFNRVHGLNMFEYLEKDARSNELLNLAMINVTTIIMKEILSTYKGFDQLDRLVDVGGGLGVALKLITSKYPQIKGISFDLPHVIQHAPHYPGVEHIAGDMFESVPEGDAIFMKSILHDWSDDHCLKLLNNCYKALPDQGKIIIVEGISPIVPDNTNATKFFCQLDMVMMAQTAGGKERTENEYLSLAIAAGFAGIRLIFDLRNMKSHNNEVVQARMLPRQPRRAWGTHTLPHPPLDTVTNPNSRDVHIVSDGDRQSPLGNSTMIDFNASEIP